MNRRAFSSVRAASEPVPHYYDWSCFDGPFTSDPQCQPLRHGKNAPTLTLNGVLRNGAVIRCVSGLNGWIESYVKDEKGYHVLADDCLRMKRIVERGVVAVTPPSDPQPDTPPKVSKPNTTFKMVYLENAP